MAPSNGTRHHTLCRSRNHSPLLLEVNPIALDIWGKANYLHQNRVHYRHMQLSTRWCLWMDVWLDGQWLCEVHPDIASCGGVACLMPLLFLAICPSSVVANFGFLGLDTDESLLWCCSSDFWTKIRVICNVIIIAVLKALDIYFGFLTWFLSFLRWGTWVVVVELPLRLARRDV